MASGTPEFLVPFITTWKTDTEWVDYTNQVKLPLDSDGTYNFVVDWGDGTSDTIAKHDQVKPPITMLVPGLITSP